MKFSQKIIQWHDQHGRKTLPWQGKNPYHVWLSEIMLQQTQVVKVIDYFDRFTTALPELDDLANAEEQQVLALWSGLGYYNRARNLHKTAKLCQQQHGSQLPEDLTQLMALPGIGRSTAAAIMSLAFDQPEPIMDGNVKRVFARHFLVAGEPNKASTLKQFWQLAETHKTDQQPAKYTQGLMDLGALLCTKHQPQCQRCPVQKTCEAKAQNVIEQYPAKKQRVKQQTIHMYVTLHTQDDQLWLVPRDASSIWPNLWFLPSHDNEQQLKDRHQATEKYFSLTHKLTHRILHIHVFQSRLAEAHPDGRWVSRQELANQPHPKALIHILDQHDNHNLH